MDLKFFILLIAAILSSCIDSNQSKNIIVGYYSSDSLVREANYRVDEIRKATGCLTLHYFNCDSTESLNLIFQICDSLVVYNNTRCFQLSSEKYLVNGNDYIVNIYLYDEDNISDEELKLYVNNDLGLLVEYSENWNICRTFTYDSISKNIIGKILLDMNRGLPKPTSSD